MSCRTQQNITRAEVVAHQFKAQTQPIFIFCHYQTKTLTSVTVTLTLWFVPVMAFWQRIRNNKLKIACAQFHRCYIQLPHASSFNSAQKTRPFQIPHPYWVFHDTPTRVFNGVRFYAAPVQVNFQASFVVEIIKVIVFTVWLDTGCLLICELWIVISNGCFS